MNGRDMSLISMITFKNGNSHFNNNARKYSMCNKMNVCRKKNHIHLLNSWEYRNYNNSFIKESDFIKSIILPNNLSKKIAEDNINLFRKNFEIIVAVHIRRGDYKFFYDGKYYFNDSVYFEKMLDIQSIFSHVKVGFAIFSNEHVNIANYNKLNVMSIQ